MNRIVGAGVTDQKEGAQARDFPEGVHVEKVIRHDQAEHGREEKEDHEEKESTIVLDAHMLSVVLRHVAQGVHRNEAADDAGDQNDDEGKIINDEIPGHIDLIAHVILEGGDDEKLEEPQGADAVALELASVVEHHPDRERVHAHHEQLHPLAADGKLLRRIKEGHSHCHRQHHHGRRGKFHQRGAERSVPAKEQHHRRHQRQEKEQQRKYHSIDLQLKFKFNG